MALIQIPLEYKSFVDSLKKKCKKHGIEMILSPSWSVNTETNNISPCGGFFDEESMSMVVGCAKPVDEWMATLVHESCHMDQWLEDKEMWNRCMNDYGLFWGWLAGDTMMNTAQVQKACETIIYVEWDCERRSVEKIRKLKLPLNISKYCRKANTYLYSYKVIHKYKIFPTGIYSHPEVYKDAPAYLLKNVNNTSDSHKIAVNHFYDKLVISQSKTKRA